MPDLQEQRGPVAGSGAAGGNGDSLSKLYHMSTTAGVGTQEYVAINPTAVAALILGLASVLALLSSMLLVIPAAGVVCGLVAIAQIRRSNQTQTGLALAACGLVLSIGMGGGRGVYHVIKRYHVSSDEQHIARLMQQLGQDLRAGNFDHAYQLFNDRFHDRINRPTFENAFLGYKKLATSGTIESIEWNREPMLMEDTPGSDVSVASAMAFFKFEKDPAPRRSVIVFEKSDGQWRIADIEAIFKNAPR